jgi:hypothetical protein
MEHRADPTVRTARPRRGRGPLDRLYLPAMPPFALGRACAWLIRSMAPLVLPWPDPRLPNCVVHRPSCDAPPHRHRAPPERRGSERARTRRRTTRRSRLA